MSIINNLKSGQNIEETIFYQGNINCNENKIINNIPINAGINDEFKIIQPVSPMVTSQQQLSYETEMAQQEIQCNQTAIRLANSRKGIKKLREEEEHENGLNQVRFNLQFKDIIPLPDGLVVNAQVPLEYFPDWVSRLISEVARSLQVPIEAVVSAMLGAIFIAARGNFEIEVKVDYHEPLTGYIVVVMPSGSRKSSIVGFFRKPINKIEVERQIEFDTNAASRKFEHKILIDHLKNIKSTIVKDIKKKSIDEIKIIIANNKEKYQSVEQEIRQLEARPMLLIDYVTPKKLYIELVRQNEAIGIMEAEGGVLKNYSQFSKSDILLKGYTMESSGYETTEVSLTLKRPCVAMCIFCQENVAIKLYSSDELKNYGLLSRILPVFASKNNEFININPTNISGYLINMYHNKINSLINIQRPAGKKGERTIYDLKLEDEARKQWQDYANSITQRIHLGFFQNFESFGEKLAGHAVRLAGALHLLKHDIPHDHGIDATTMSGGIALAEYFATHAAVAFDKSSLQGLEYAKKILKWIDRRGITEFTVREANRGVGDWNVNDIRAGLDVLEKHGFIGRYQKYCVVNPRYRLAWNGPQYPITPFF